MTDKAEHVFAVAPGGPRSAHHEAGHLAQVADHRETAVGRVAVMDVAFAAVRGAFGVGHVLAEKLMRRRAQQQMAEQIAVHDRNHVAAGPKRQGHAQGGRFVADAGRDRPFDVSLFIEFDHPLFHAAGKKHQRIGDGVKIFVRKPLGKTDDAGRWLAIGRRQSSNCDKAPSTQRPFPSEWRSAGCATARYL